MIVKNEAHVIARCLASVRPLITSWAIVDTGSTDGTQALVREALAGLPGELHERPWRDFATNRNEAIELAEAQADYLLIIDADDTLAVPARFALPPLTADCYQLRVADAGTSYLRTHLFRARAGFRYVGVLHEVLIGPAGHSTARIDEVRYLRTNDGARSADPQKFRKDAAVLEAALLAEPDNARYAFYLAQSWRDAGELEKALDGYAKRATMAGWEEEVWYALYEVARLTARLGRGDDAVVAAYLRAYENRPSRAESLTYLAMYLREKDRIVAAYPFARVASETPRPADLLFLDDAVYAWRALDELAVAAYWMGRHDEALAANQRLLSSAALPAGERARVETNLGFSRAKLAERPRPLPRRARRARRGA
jgi:glycosyltransferase involved in cell wall biosynthesis